MVRFKVQEIRHKNWTEPESILQLATDPHGVLRTTCGLHKDWARTAVDSMRSHQPNGQFPVHLLSTSHPLPVQSTWSGPCGLHEDAVNNCSFPGLNPYPHVLWEKCMC